MFEVMTKMRFQWLMLASAVTALTLTPMVPPMPVPTAHAQLFSMSEQQEIQLGRQVEAEVAKKPGFVDDPGLTSYVAGIGLRLAHVSERPNLPWTYHIVRDKSVNAFAVLGGFVFVDQGLLTFVKSEDELAFILGHETTHVAHRHAVDLAQRDLEVQFGAVLLTQFVFGGSWTAYQLSQIARGLVDAKYSRDKEFEADRYGVIYAQKAGFNSSAAISFFERLQRLDKTQPALAHAFEDHPDTPDRIKALRAQLHQMGYQVAGPEAPAPAPGPAVKPSSAQTAPHSTVSGDR
ncbi:MAG TPA: M48 family metalloprotease [bacterium]|nr:M48 family metalloprotease [bacterium]